MTKSTSCLHFCSFYMSFSAKKPGKTNYFKLFFTLLQNVNVFTYRYIFWFFYWKKISQKFQRFLLPSEHIAKNNSKLSCTVRKKWKHENFQYFGDGKWYGWKMFSICFKLKRCQVGTYRYKKNQPGPNLNFFTRTFLSLNIFVRYSDVIGNHAVSFLMNIYYFIYYLLVVGAGTYCFFILVWK